MLRRKPYWQAKKLRIKEDKDSLNSLRPTIWGASWNVPSAIPVNQICQKNFMASLKGICQLTD
jgi:hypothetical protein